MTAPTSTAHSLKYLAAQALQTPPDPVEVPAEVIQFCRNVGYIDLHLPDDIDECYGLTAEVNDVYGTVSELPDHITQDVVDELAGMVGMLTQRIYPVRSRIEQMAQWLSGELTDPMLVEAHELYTAMAASLATCDEWLSAMSVRIGELMRG